MAAMGFWGHDAKKLRLCLFHSSSILPEDSGFNQLPLHVHTLPALSCLAQHSSAVSKSEVVGRDGARKSSLTMWREREGMCNIK